MGISGSASSCDAATTAATATISDSPLSSSPAHHQASSDSNMNFSERALSAAGAAVLSAVLVNPLDVAKTRLQAQAARPPGHPTEQGGLGGRMMSIGPNRVLWENVCHMGWHESWPRWSVHLNPLLPLHHSQITSFIPSSKTPTMVLLPQHHISPWQPLHPTTSSTLMATTTTLHPPPQDQALETSSSSDSSLTHVAKHVKLFPGPINEGGEALIQVVGYPLERL